MSVDIIQKYDQTTAMEIINLDNWKQLNIFLHVIFEYITPPLDKQLNFLLKKKGKKQMMVKATPLVQLINYLKNEIQIA